MARRLGELLVAKGKLSDDQLKKALQAQMIWGGHLGTNLIELGYVTEDELGEILAEAHRVHYAPYRILQEIPSSVLAAIPKGLIEKYKIVPFRFDGKKLHLVMLSPQDLIALDEVSFATGFQLVPYVTPEIRLFQILEKYYNIPRTKRYITLSHEMSLRSPARAPESRADLDARRPGDVARPAPSILGGGPQPAPRSESPAKSEPSPPAAEEGDLDLLQSPATDWTPYARAGAQAPVEELVPEPDEESSVPHSDRILDALLRAQTLEEICSALIDVAAGALRRCGVFARSGEAFVAMTGLSANTGPWAVEGLALPFDAPAAEALFAEGRTYYIGPPPGGADESGFYQRLGGAPPPNVLVAPIRLNERIALLLYGDHIDEEVRPHEIADVLSLLHQAGLALDLLALRRKDSPA